jgi:hypothetical protein
LTLYNYPRRRIPAFIPHGIKASLCVWGAGILLLDAGLDRHTSARASLEPGLPGGNARPGREKGAAAHRRVFEIDRRFTAGPRIAMIWARILGHDTTAVTSGLTAAFSRPSR